MFNHSLSVSEKDRQREKLNVFLFGFPASLHLSLKTCDHQKPGKTPPKVKK